MTVRIPIKADGGQVAKVFEEIRKAMERSGQAGRELAKIDLSHPELKEHADDLRKILAHYNELKQVWRQLGTRTRATGQGQAAPWDLDLQRMYPTTGQAERARETLGRRLLEGTSWGARLPPPGNPPGGGGGVPGIPGLGIPGMGGLLKFTLGLAGLGGIASMARQGVGQAQQEATTLDPLWRRLQSTAGSFDELRDKTRDLGRGLGMTYEKSVQLGSEFARLSGAADVSGMARGARAGIGLARGLGMDPEAGVSFMGRSRFKGLFSGGEERQFAASIAAGVREGGMQAMPEKVLQAVEQLTDSLVRRGVDAGSQVKDMLGVMAHMNASRNPALRGEFGQAMMAQIGQGMTSPGMGDAGQFFMYRALGIRDPFKSQLARERGPFARGDDGVMAIEKILRQSRIDVPNNPYQRAVGMSGVFGIPGNAWMALERLFQEKRAQGVEPQQADVEKILTELGGNQGADTLRLLTGMHNALTVAGSPILTPLNSMMGALEYMARLVGYKPALPPPSVSGTIERRKPDAELPPVMLRLRRAIDRESKGIPGLAQVLDATARLESNYSPRAGLGTDHVGIMQLSKATAMRYGVRPEERADIDKSVHAAARYLRDNKALLGRWDLAAGAYVAGEGNMQNYLAGKPSGVGPDTKRRMAEIGGLGLDPPQRGGAGRFDLNVTVAVPGVGKVVRAVSVGTPQSSGGAAVSIP